MKPNINNAVRPSRVKLSTAIQFLLIATSMTTWTGCARYKVLAADRAVLPLEGGQVFRVPHDGWFVPDARWQEIREAIALRIKELEKPEEHR